MMIYRWLHTYLALTSIIYECQRNMVDGTIDLNLSELEYLAAHLDPYECRRLIAALHYDSYELPHSLSAAERQVSDDVPCLRQLLHWNAEEGEGRGKTHERIEHRLRQLGHAELADWLGRTAFKELGKDLLRSFEDLGDDLEQLQSITAVLNETYTETTEPASDELSDEKIFWHSIELISVSLFGLLVFMLLVVVGALIIDKVAWCHEENGKIPIDLS